MIKRVLIGIVIIAVIGTVLWMGNINKKRMSEKINAVSTEKIYVTDTINIDIDAKGKIKAKSNKVFHGFAPFNAIIKEIYVEDKQLVQKGQKLLAIMRYPENEYENKLNGMNLQLEDMEQQLDKLNEGVYSYKKLKKEIEILENDILKLKKEQNYLIKSENKGNVIFKKELFKGGAIIANDSIMEVIDFSNINNLYVEAELSDSEYKNINKDSKVEISINEGMETNFIEGKISSNIPEVREKNEITYYAIQIDLKKDEVTSKLNLQLDVPVNVKIKSSIQMKNQQVADGEYYVLPIYAIIMRNNKNSVLLYTKDGNSEEYYAQLINVEVLASNDNKVIVRSNELNKDSVVITEGNYDLQGGEKVVIGDGKNEGSLDLNLFN